MKHLLFESLIVMEYIFLYFIPSTEYFLRSGTVHIPDLLYLVEKEDLRVDWLNVPFVQIVNLRIDGPKSILF